MVLGWTLSSCAQSTLVSAADGHLLYMGRHDSLADAAVFYWPGSSVEVSFEGTGASVTLQDEKGENYYYCLVDDSVWKKLQPSMSKDTYPIASGLARGRHTVRLFRLTEAQWGKTWFYGFKLQGNARLLGTRLPARKIEFYGNSITCGYAVDDTVKDSGKPEYENNYVAYGAITARHYHAAYSCVSKSGIGLMVSWFPIIMPEMYDRTNPEDSVRKWDFRNYTPDVVVINLLQNDSWLLKMHDHQQFIARFGNREPDSTQVIAAYKQFLGSIRARYPAATIICCLGSMDATEAGKPWTRYIQQAVQQSGDGRTLVHFFAYKHTPGHPKRAEQQAMADDLISFIDAHVKW